MTAAAIALLLASLAPNFQPQDEAAQLLEQLTAEYNIDPALVVRYVRHESGWNPNAEHINSTDIYVGLGQVRARNYAECMTDMQSTACLERRAALFDWRTNLTETVHDFALARAYCHEVAHVNGARYWLSVVTGYDVKNHTTCGHRRGRAQPIPVSIRVLTGARDVSLKRGYVVATKRSRMVSKNRK